MIKKLFSCFSVILITSLMGCSLPATALSAEQAATQSITSVIETTKNPNPTETIPIATLMPQSTGSVNTPALINPLNGLPVQDPSLLSLPPVLVSISNFPPTSRPQAGLSYSPIVFEVFIGDGMTRDLAVFYGDYPAKAVQAQSPESQTGELSESSIGPIRSGRVSYEKIRQIFNGLLVMASAYKTVAQSLSNYSNIFGSDESDLNSAMMKVTQLQAIAQNGQIVVDSAELSGMEFDSQPPVGAKPGQSLWLFYSNLNQIFWRFNQTDGTYHRFQDNADGATFIEATDRLNDKPLAYSNVVVLFVKHIVIKKYMIDLDLLYQKRNQALIFRDGKMYDVYWTTKSGEYEQSTGKLRPIRFIDAQGNPFLLKPGQTWIETVPLYTAYWETVNSEAYNQLMSGREPGSGYWAVRFKDPTIGY